MAMSRKHYREAAEIIRRVRSDYPDTPGTGDTFDRAGRALEDVADYLADMFKADNSNFDRQRFLDACGL